MTNNDTALATYTFDSAAVRVVTINNEPWFVVADACKVLDIQNPSSAVQSLDEDEKAKFNLGLAGSEVNIVSESGLYALILRCRDAMTPGTAAHRFRKWVTSEVLPQIRKTGGYHMPRNHAEALRALADTVEENERLRLTVQEQAPAVEFVRKYVKAEGLFGIRETAKILELQQKVFVGMLIERKVMFRENGTLQPYAPWLEAGYFKVKTGEANEHAFKQARFTSSGIEWVRKYLEINKLLAMSA